MLGVDVTRQTFMELLPVIKGKIDQAVFVAVDLEFTGLNINSHTKSSLFDSADDRYQKAKRNIQDFTIAQFGLAAYHSVGTNRYDAYIFNCYLFPEAHAGMDSCISMQASSIQFLTQYGFDFNKMLYEGIPFVNQSQKVRMENYWTRHTSGRQELTDTQKNILRGYSVRLTRWLVQARDGDIFTLDKTSENGDVPNTALHEILLHRIENIWPRPSDDDVLIVEKVSAERRKELMKTSSTFIQDKDKFVENSTGFTRVIDYLISKKKIIVGHNLYLDLMFIYEKFINPLPSSYTEYKAVLHSCFPHIYDTKFLALQLRRSLESSVHGYDQTSLSELYTHMRDSDRTSGLLFAPSVHIANSTRDEQEGGRNGQSSDDVEGQIHEAGFDSYMCGYVFLRLTHLLTLNVSDAALASHPIPFYDYQIPLSKYKNRVNMIRGALHHICLDGPDPESSRPDQLFVATRKYNSQLNIDEISLLLSSFGSVDINIISHNKAVVAVNSFSSSRRILEAFRQHDKFVVKKYSSFRHSPRVTRFLMAGLALTAGICAAALIRSVRKR
ncbi:poly(A)-specific ribonuclease PNLDC1-like [Watersipora subatra]|uniref:poly(A)-specific ribonuclease PNLDC1-like n=1 Tax=Watersipora subatra TaxID=2589382 RepID=UPI00355B7E4F